VPRAFGSGVRTVPASHGRSGAGRGADAGCIRSGVGAAGHIPGRERVLLVALPAHRERGLAGAAGGAATGAAHRHDRPSGGPRATPARDRGSGDRARSRACRRGLTFGSARGIRVARRRRVPARRDRQAHRHRGGNVQSAAVPGAPAVTRGIESMMCPHMEATLNEYVDGTLPAGDRPAVEAHLAECAGCRAAATELRRLIAEAHGLPRSIEPRRNLWTTIEAQIVQRARYNVQRAFWRGALAAAAVLVIALGLFRLLPLSTAHYRPAGRGWVGVRADFQDGGVMATTGTWLTVALALLGRQAMAQARVDQRWPLDPGGSVRIVSPFGRIRVLGWDVDSVAVSGRLDAGAGRFYATGD